MKTLEKIFTKSKDGTGPCIFEQMRAEEPFFIYRRTKKENGIVLGYEVFKAHVIKKGTKHPHKDLVEPEDKYCYPGAKSFNKLARFVGGVGDLTARANAAFEEIKELSRAGETEGELNEEGVMEPGKPRGRGRKFINRSKIVFPNKEKFNIKEMAEVNKGIASAGFCYIHLKNLISSGIIEVVERVSGGRGKPESFYAFVNKKK